MTTIDKDWNIGDGVIHLEYDGDGNGQIAVTLTSNEGIDREQVVEVQTTNGAVSESITIKQEGLREVFSCADGDFILADGGTFNVLKEGGGMPSEYTILEQLDFNGNYVDTGFKPNNNTRVVMEVYAESNPAASHLFGARYSATSNNYAFLYIANTKTFRSDYNGTYTQTWSATLGQNLVVDKNKETTTFGGISKSYTNATFQSNYNLYLFATNEKNSPIYITEGFLFRSCQIYDNDELIRDYVPVTNGADYGLWDKVNREFIKIY